MRSVRLMVCGLAVAGLVLASGLQNAEARPNYLPEFKNAYPAVKEVDTVKCGVCHIGKPTDKKWNDYGMTIGKALGKPKAKKDEVQAALKKSEAEKSGTDGMTYGELLKAGKLPGKAE
jgi:hypothetical protein